MYDLHSYTVFCTNNLHDQRDMKKLGKAQDMLFFCLFIFALIICSCNTLQKK